MTRFAVTHRRPHVRYVQPSERHELARGPPGGPSQIFTAHGGDLIVMGGRCQRDYKHSVPKQKPVTRARVSLNFSGAHVS